MPAGANKKREREYNELKGEFKKEGRYKGREDEVAARIVNKQRASMSETRSARAKDRKGTSPDEGLPIRNYDSQTIGTIQQRVMRLSPQEIRDVRNYEKKHKNRATLMPKLEQAEKDAKQREKGGNGRTKAAASRLRGSASARESGRGESRSRSRGATSKSGGRSSVRGRGESRARTSSGGGERRRTSGRGEPLTKHTQDHETIRRWAEARDAKPVSVRGTGSETDAGLLRLNFPGYAPGDRFEEIGWDDFFEKFDQKGLEFIYQEKRRNGETSNFFKFVMPSSVKSR